LLIGNAIIKPANAPYTVVLSDDDAIEHTVSQPKTEHKQTQQQHQSLLLLLLFSYLNIYIRTITKQIK